MDNPLRIEGNERSGALFSQDGIYRYRLWRNWTIEPGPRVLWIMLNPSTADHEKDDPTVTRCIRFSQGWGYAGLEVMNMFALRATDPRILKEHPAPEGEENLPQIRSALRAGGFIKVICAWGVNAGSRTERIKGEVPVSLRFHLGLTKGGHPKHPLYLRGDTKPQPWA